MARPVKKKTIAKPTDIKALVLRGQAAHRAVDKFSFDRSKFLNASEAAGCIRWQWYRKHAPELSGEDSWGYAYRGHAVEAYMVEMMRMANAPLRGAGEDQQSIQDDETKISATPDGWLDYGEDGEVEVTEFKSIDPRYNKNNLPKKEHVIQLQIGMELMHKVTDIKPERGILCYTDASNFDDIIQFPIRRDKNILKKMEQRARKVLRSKKVDALDREGKTNNECRYCPFAKACGVTGASATSQARSPKTSRANRGSALAEDVSSYVDAKGREAAAKAEKDAAAESIKEELASRKTNELTVGGFKVRLQAVKGRTSLDKAAVKKAGIDLSPFEKVGAPSERLTIDAT
jgi:hypothetical protein